MYTLPPTQPKTIADTLILQAFNNATSNSRLIEACKQLSHADLHQKRVSFFPTILETLNHIYVVDLYYMDGVENNGGGPNVFYGYKPFTDFKTFAEARHQLDTHIIAYCKSLKESDMAKTVILQRRERQDSETVFTVMSHLFVHQIHHRGQVHSMLSGTPVPPPQLDEFFLFVDKPLVQRDFDIYRI